MKKQASDTMAFDRPKSVLAEYFGVARLSLERVLTRMEEGGGRIPASQRDGEGLRESGEADKRLKRKRTTLWCAERSKKGSIFASLFLA